MPRIFTRCLALLLACFFVLQSLVFSPLSVLAATTTLRSAFLPDIQKISPTIELPTAQTVAAIEHSLPLNFYVDSDTQDPGDAQSTLLSTSGNPSIASANTQNIYNFGDSPIFIMGDHNTINLIQGEPEENIFQQEEEVFQTEDAFQEEEEVEQPTHQQRTFQEEETEQPSTHQPQESIETPVNVRQASKSGSPECNSSESLDCALYDRGYIRLSGDTLAQNDFDAAIKAAIARGDDTIIDVRQVSTFEIVESSLETIGNNFDHYIWVVGDPQNPTVFQGDESTQLLSIDNEGEGFFAFFGVTFADGLARGGDGKKGGGGGLGAGGALFINNGHVIIDQSTFKGNAAQGGNSTGLAGSGGNTDESGKPGGDGGAFNETAKFSYEGGEGGEGNPPCDNEDDVRCQPTKASMGKEGQFGSGGGSGGGGGGEAHRGDDAAGNGGHGGDGQFGAGGGGGGGGGDEEDEKDQEDGYGGDGGIGGVYGGEGACGVNGSIPGTAPGGGGGGGASLGAAIFVRETEGANLQLNSSSFVSNLVIAGNTEAPENVVKRCYPTGGQAYGEAIFVLRNENSDSSETNPFFDDPVDSEELFDYDTDGDTLPTLSLSLVDLDENDLSNADLGDKQYKVLEGERINLKLSVEDGTIADGQSVYFYLSQTNALAKQGNSEDQSDIADQTDADFAWDQHMYYELIAPDSIGAGKVFYLSIPYHEDPDWTNALGAYSGLQTYIDKLLEGDENFTIDLLPGEGYKLTTEPSIDGTPGYSQRVIIEDSNYQVELIRGRSNTQIADVANALAPKDGLFGDLFGENNETIDVTNLKGLGYVTVQARRPVNVSHARDEDELPNSSDWSTTDGKYDSTVNGDLFNNALAGGLPIHYTVTPNDGGEEGVDYWVNQVNYRNEKYDPQIYEAVVIPVTDVDQEPDPDVLPPGQARIYFAALPDAVQEEPERYTLTIVPFTDPSYNAEYFCGEEVEPDCDSVLQNTPEGDYQFYKVRSGADTAIFTLNDSQEFTAGLIVVDNVNGEVVNDSNPLVPDAEGIVQFWIKLGSQPASKVVTVRGDMTPGVLTFTPDNWYHYQHVTYTGSADSIELSIDSEDPFYRFENALPLAAEYDHFKVTEGAIPDLSQRTVTLGVVASVATTTEGNIKSPKFIISLGQPLPRDLEIAYKLEPSADGEDEFLGTVTLPKYQQRVTLPYAVPDDDLVEADEQVTLTLIADNLPDGVSLEEGGESAQFTLKDNDKARVLIKRHLPEKPTEGDVALFLPEFYIAGQRNDGSLIVHSLSPGVEQLGLSLVTVDMDDLEEIHNYGLLREVAVNLAGDDDPIINRGTPIVFPDHADRVKVETFNTQSLSLTDLPSGEVTRLRGQLEIPTEGDYTFSISDVSGQVELWIDGLQVATVPQDFPPISQHLQIGLHDILVLYQPIVDTPQAPLSRTVTPVSIAQIKVTPANSKKVLQLSEIEAYGKLLGYPGQEGKTCQRPEDCDLALSKYDGVIQASSVLIDNTFKDEQEIIDTVIDGEGPDRYDDAYVSAEADPDPYVLVTLPEPEPLVQLTILKETSGRELDDYNIYNVDLLDEDGNTVFQSFNLSAVGEDVDGVTINDFSQSDTSPLTISWDNGAGPVPIPANVLRFPAIDSGFSLDPYVAPSNYVKQIKITSAYGGSDPMLQISEVVAGDADGNDVALTETATVTGSTPEAGTALENAIDGIGLSENPEMYRSSAENAELIITLNHPTPLEFLQIQGSQNESTGRDIYNLELLNDKGQVISNIINLDANNDEHFVFAFTTGKSVKRIRVIPARDLKLTADKHLTIAEVQAMDRDGNDLALRSAGARAIASSVTRGAWPWNAIDGVTDSAPEDSYQSLPQPTDQYLLVDLAYPSDIATLTIHAANDDDTNKDYIVELLNRYDDVLARFPIEADSEDRKTVQLNKLVAKLRVTPTHANTLQISEVIAEGIFSFEEGMEDQRDLALLDLGARATASTPFNDSTGPINVIDGKGPEAAEQQNYISKDETGEAELIVTLPYLSKLSTITLQGRADPNYSSSNIYNLELLTIRDEVIEAFEQIDASQSPYERTRPVASSSPLKNAKLQPTQELVAESTVNEVSVLPEALDFFSTIPVTETMRFQAVITPPESGEYRFALASSSDSRLFVEPLETTDYDSVHHPMPLGSHLIPRHKPIAYIDGDENQNDFPRPYQWQWSRSKNTRSQQRSLSQSQPIELQADKPYLLSVQLDAASDDAIDKGIPSYLAVAWNPPSGSGLELLKTFTSNARPSTQVVFLPLRLSSSPTLKDGLIHTTIEIADPVITSGDNQYEVKSVTLVGDPAYDYPDSATPSIPPTFIPFASGFLGHLAHDITLTSGTSDDTSEPIEIEPLDSAIIAETLNLSLGEQRRISFELESPPAKNTTVTVNLSEQSPPGSGAKIELYCPDESGELADDCTPLYFDATNWNEPQYLTVEGVAPGTDLSGRFDPLSSYVDLVAIPSPSEGSVAKQTGEGSVAKQTESYGEAAFIKVKLFPQLEDFTVYYVDTNGEVLNWVGFAEPSGDNLPTISYMNADGTTQDLTQDWSWEKDENDIVAKQGDVEILRLVAHEEPLLPGRPDQPVQLTAKAIVSDELFRGEAPWAGIITISGIKLQAEGEETSSTVPIDLVLNTGTPTIETHDILSGSLPFNDVQKVIYETTTGDVTEVGVNEPLITEYGVFLFDRYNKYYYEANPRPQPAEGELSFTVVNDLDVERQYAIDLSLYLEGVRIATSLFADSDGRKPLARPVVTQPTVSEADGEAVVTIELDRTTAAEQDLAEDLGSVSVHYMVVSSDAQARPFDDALSLGSPKLALEIRSEDDNNLVIDPWSFTLEFWLSYINEGASTQGLLTVQDQDGDLNETTLMQIDRNNGQLIFRDEDLNINLEDYGIGQGQAFHVTYRSSEKGQAIFINGRKQSVTDKRLDRNFNQIKAIGRDDADQYFIGVIDEVRLWTLPQSDQQIQQNYRISTLAETDELVELEGLVGDWTFNGSNFDNQAQTGVELKAIDPANNEISVTDLPWRSRIAATECKDYTLPDSICDQRNFFGLDAGLLGGQTTFDIVDLNDDDNPDAIVVDGYGNVTLYKNKGLNRDLRSTFEVKPLDIQLGEATPITTGDIDGDGDIDLIFGTQDGQIKLIENNGSKRTVRFQQPRTLRADGQRSQSSGSITPTLADLDGDGVAELITLDSAGAMREFKFGSNRGELAFQPRPTSLLPKLQSDSEGYFVQFLDLDLDGDLDLLVDLMHNRPGQPGGGSHYYVNYGTPESPYFVESRHNAIAVALRNLDTQVTYGNRTFKTPYDQAQFYHYSDWNGDGILERFQSDNKGEIHLLSTGNNEHTVIIPAGENTADIPITLLPDSDSEGLEYIQLQLVQARLDDSYHIQSNRDQATIEITDRDSVKTYNRINTAGSDGLISDNSIQISDIQVLDSAGQPVSWDRDNPIEVSEVSDQPIQYQVKLTSVPSSDVQMTITSSQPGQGLVAKADPDGQPGALKEAITLYVSQDEWNEPQSFWVQGVDDQVDDDNALYAYVFTTRSGDPAYGSILKVLQAVSTGNDETAGLDFTFDTLPELALAEGALLTTEGAINTVKVALSSKPTQTVTVTLAPVDREITFYPQRRIIENVEIDPMSHQVTTIPVLSDREGEGDCDLWDQLKDGTLSLGKYGDLCWRANGDFVYTQRKSVTADEPVDEFSFTIDNGYGLLGGESISVPVALIDIYNPEETPLVTRRGNLFFNGNELAGQPMSLTFTPSDWNLEQTVAVAAIDDDRVEYHHDSYIRVLLSDPNQALYATYGTLQWTPEGLLTYTRTPAQQLDPGEYREQRFYFTQSGDKIYNHTLDLRLTAIEGDEEISYTVSAIVDQADQDTHPPPIS